MVAWLGPALKSDYSCKWDRDGQGPVPPDSLLTPCSIVIEPNHSSDRFLERQRGQMSKRGGTAS